MKNDNWEGNICSGTSLKVDAQSVTFDGLIAALVREYDSETFEENRVLEELVSILRDLQPSVRRRIRATIRELARRRNMPLGLMRMNERVLGRILLGIAYWTWVTEAFAMAMASDDDLRKATWDHLETLSGLAKAEIGAIAEEWDESGRGKVELENRDNSSD